jgi:hypothetical protein
MHQMQLQPVHNQRQKLLSRLPHRTLITLVYFVFYERNDRNTIQKKLSILLPLTPVDAIWHHENFVSSKYYGILPFLPVE